MIVDKAVVVLLTEAIRLECCRADQIADDAPAIPFGQVAARLTDDVLMAAFHSVQAQGTHPPFRMSYDKTRAILLAALEAGEPTPPSEARPNVDGLTDARGWALDDGHATLKPYESHWTDGWADWLTAHGWLPVPGGYAKGWSHTDGHYICLSLNFHNYGAWAIIEDGNLSHRRRIGLATVYTLEQVEALFAALESTSWDRQHHLHDERSAIDRAEVPSPRPRPEETPAPPFPGAETR